MKPVGAGQFIDLMRSPSLSTFMAGVAGQRGLPARAGASRTNSSLRSDFVRARIFPLTLRFDLDGPPLRVVPSRPKPFGETKKFFRSPAFCRALRTPLSQVQRESAGSSINAYSCMLRPYHRFLGGIYHGKATRSVMPHRNSAARFSPITASPQSSFLLPAFLQPDYGIYRPDVQPTGRARSVPPFPHHGCESFRSRIIKSVARGLILRFLFRVQNKRPCKEQRTSYVLWPPRILADARCPQHACQGFQPVDPTREELSPLVWTLSAEARRGGVA